MQRRLVRTESFQRFERKNAATFRGTSLSPLPACALFSCRPHAPVQHSRRRRERGGAMLIRFVVQRSRRSMSRPRLSCADWQPMEIWSGCKSSSNRPTWISTLLVAFHCA
jgi:hypothetical protein